MVLKKKEVVEALFKELETKEKQLHSEWKDLQNALGSETKSTAGDKHETGRAMTHLELERVGKNLHQLREQKEHLQKTDFNKVDGHTISNGCLIRTDRGYYLLAISFGPLQLKGETCFVLSPLSPVGRMLPGSSRGEVITYRDLQFKILNFE